MNDIRLGLVHGRFQPFHLGHLEYTLAAKRKCKKLIVGLTNPDPWQVRKEATAPHRHKQHANPFTFYERYCMIETSLRDAGVDAEAFQIIPFPHSFPERLLCYAPIDAVMFLNVYDSWSETKQKRLIALGYRTYVLSRRGNVGPCGTDIRGLIRASGDWQRFVPAGTAKIIMQTAWFEKIAHLRNHTVKKR